MSISQEFINNVLERTDIVSVISEVVQLKGRQSSNGSYMGKCPFHKDNSPSFSVSGAKQIYHCFGCDAGLNGKQGGDAITFVRRHYEIGFRDAVEHLAHRAGIQVPDDWGSGQNALQTNSKPVLPNRPHAVQQNAREFSFLPPGVKAPPLDAQKREILQRMSQAESIYTAFLGEHSEAYDYLVKNRGLSDLVISRFSVGYAPDGYQNLTSAFPYYGADRVLQDAGLVKKSERTGTFYDVFRDRVLFGLRDMNGQVVAFGGRRLKEPEKKNRQADDADEGFVPPKYLNSPETLVFCKKDMLFGLYEAQQDIRACGTALVVEGYMDVMGLAAQRINNAVASMGTAVTESHFNLLQDHANKIIFLMDGDAAGQKAAYRAIEPAFATLKAECDVRFLTLPDDLDPDDYVKKHGPLALNQLLEGAADLPTFFEHYLYYWQTQNENLVGSLATTLSREVERLLQLIPSQMRDTPIYNALGAVATKILTPRAQSNNSATEPVVLPRYIRHLLIAANRLPIKALNKIEILKNVLDMDIPEQAALYEQFNLAIGIGMEHQYGKNSASEDLLGTADEILNCIENIVQEFSAQSTQRYEQQALARGEISEKEHLERLDKRVRMREN